MFLVTSCAALAAGPRSEFRGAWVTAWGNGLLSSAEVDETVRLAKEANLNALFVQVRKVGDAYYRSSYEPRATNITGGDDYDPLAYIVEKAHAQGIEVHAWLNTFRIWSKSAHPDDPSHIAVRNPDWITRTSTGDVKASEGLFLDPGVQEVQDYTTEVFLDVVRNYDIDGIHLDYVRYPGKEFGYAPPAVERFNSEKGRGGIPVNTDPAWMDWRRDQVTALVARIYKASIALKPNIKVTAATVPWGDCAADFCDTLPFRHVYQDWRSWMELGILDACIPMNYRDEGNAKHSREYRNWLDGFKRWQYSRHMYTGLDFNVQPAMVVRQLTAARSRELKGMVGFSFNQSPERVKLVQALKADVFAEPALVPEMPWKLGAVKFASRDRYFKAINAATSGRDIDKAIVLLKESIGLDPNYTDAHFRLGRCYLRKEMFEDAVKEFDTTLSIDPKYISAARQKEIALAEIAKRRK